MLSVGLTGGIACGKSTVSGMFVRLGAYLIDLDVIAHEVQEPGKLAYQEIIECFGGDILGQDKKIDRNKLAAIVFNQAEKLKALNDIVHPRVFQEWQSRLEKIKASNSHAIVLSDIPLLFEGRMQALFDLTILVMIPPGEQIKRLIKRNGLSPEEARLRLVSQLPIEDKISMADIVIDNRSSIADTENKVKEVWPELIRREKAQN
jgi:dephospho-CoA kinase